MTDPQYQQLNIICEVQYPVIFLTSSSDSDNHPSPLPLLLATTPTDLSRLSPMERELRGVWYQSSVPRGTPPIVLSGYFDSSRPRDRPLQREPLSLRPHPEFPPPGYPLRTGTPFGEEYLGVPFLAFRKKPSKSKIRAFKPRTQYTPSFMPYLDRLADLRDAHLQSQKQYGNFWSTPTIPLDVHNRFFNSTNQMRNQSFASTFALPVSTSELPSDILLMLFDELEGSDCLPGLRLVSQLLVTPIRYRQITLTQDIVSICGSQSQPDNGGVRYTVAENIQLFTKHVEINRKLEVTPTVMFLFSMKKVRRIRYVVIHQL